MKYLFLLLMMPVLTCAQTRKQYAIGDTAFCGIVYYVASTDSFGGQRGLVCAMEDESAAATWNNGTYVQTGATKDVLFDKANATKIISVQKPGAYAATVCSAYFPLIAGKSCDSISYLPSKTELLLLYKNMAATKKMKFVNEGYWTSVEYKSPAATTSKTQKKAAIVDFLNGKSFAVNKANKYHVRAIREFKN